MQKTNQAYIQDSTDEQHKNKATPVVSNQRHVKFDISPSHRVPPPNQSDDTSSTNLPKTVVGDLIVLETYRVSNAQKSNVFNIKNPKKCAISVIVVLTLFIVFVIIPIIISLSL